MSEFCDFVESIYIPDYSMECENPDLFQQKTCLLNKTKTMAIFVVVKKLNYICGERQKMF